MEEEKNDYKQVIILTVCKLQIHVNDQDYPASSGWWWHFLASFPTRSSYIATDPKMTYKWPPAPTLRMSHNTYVDEMICRINDHSNELYCHNITLGVVWPVQEFVQLLTSS